MFPDFQELGGGEFGQVQVRWELPLGHRVYKPGPVWNCRCPSASFLSLCCRSSPSHLWGAPRSGSCGIKHLRRQLLVRKVGRIKDTGRMNALLCAGNGALYIWARCRHCCVRATLYIWAQCMHCCVQAVGHSPSVLSACTALCRR